MKSVIMAGGEGSRLRPLTCDIPKPLAKLCGRPVIEYILDLLGSHGVDFAAVTVKYLSGLIDEHFESRRYGNINLDIVKEESFLGTAGGVKNAARMFSEDFLGEAFLVISGDAMCDFDLSAAVSFHQKGGSAATIVVKRMADPREYGLVVAGAGGAVACFLEKPGFTQAVSDLANTGVYILSPDCLKLIPDNTVFDFAKDLFPLMLSRKMKISFFEEKGYWCDIGDLATYRACQLDMLNGRVKCDIKANRDRDGNFFQGRKPAGNYTLIPPVYIGEGVSIGDGAIVENSVVGSRSVLKSGSRARFSVLDENCLLEENARATAAVLCQAVTVKRDASVFEEAAVGAGTVIGQAAVINAGVKIWPKKTVEDGAVVSENLKYGAGHREHFDDEGIFGKVGVEITPDFCAKLGQAIGSLGKFPRVGVAMATTSGAGAASQSLKNAVAAGLQSCGSDVLDFGELTLPMLNFLSSHYGLGLSVFIDAAAEPALRLISAGGLPPTRAMERSVESILARGEYARREPEGFGRDTAVSGGLYLYENMLSAALGKRLPGNVKLSCGNSLIQEIIGRLPVSGQDGEDALAFEISGDGRKLSCRFGAKTLDHDTLFSLCALLEFKSGRDIAVRFDSIHVLEDMARDYGRTVCRYFDNPADTDDELERKQAVSCLWERDALLMALTILSGMEVQNISMKELLLLVPSFHVKKRKVPVSGGVVSLMAELGGMAAKQDKITEGVVISEQRGTVIVKPLKWGKAIQIIAESAKAETAAELCDFFAGIIEQKNKQ